MKNFKLVKQTASVALILTSFLTCLGCAKKVECSIGNKHVHLYVNEDYHLSRYIDSEKEVVGELHRTNNYLAMNDILNIVADNEFYMVQDNIDYLIETMNESRPTRQSYSFGLIYGPYVGYDFGFNPSTGKVEYYSGVHTGWHEGYEWKDISPEEETSDRVRDITYKFKFYNINESGTISYALFDSLTEVTDEYKYFKTTDLVQKEFSDSYYLTNQK